MIESPGLQKLIETYKKSQVIFSEGKPWDRNVYHLLRQHKALSGAWV